MKYHVPLSAQIEGTRYVLEGWPTLAAALLGLLAVAALALTLRRVFDLRTSAAMALGAAFFASCVGSLWAAVGGSAGGPSAPMRVTLLFFVPLFVEHTAVVLGFVAGLVGVAQMVKAQRASLGALLGFAALTLALPVLFHARSIKELEVLPRGALDGPPHLHLGKKRAITPVLIDEKGEPYDGPSYRVSALESEIVGEKLGPREVVVRASREWISLETRAAITVVEARASGLFPLQDGLVHLYRGEDHCEYGGGEKETSESEQEIRVQAAGERDGLSIYRIEGPRGDPWEAYAADGETYWIRTGFDAPFSAPVVEWDREKGAACYFAPAALEATCRADPERIESFKNNHGTGTMDRVAVKIFTLGIVSMRESSCTEKLDWVSSTIDHD